MKVRLGGGAALLALVLAGCGGSSDQWSKSEKTYQSAADKLDDAHTKFESAADQLDSKNSAPEAYVAPVTSYVAALRAFNDTITKTPWPTGVQPDATALASADSALIDALEKFVTLGPQGSQTAIANVGDTIDTATNNTASASNRFAADLARRGAPAPRSSSPSSSTSPTS